MNKLTKPDFNDVLVSWLKKFLNKKFPQAEIEIIVPDRFLSKSDNEKLRTIPNRAFFEFKPDVLGIIKQNNQVDLVLLNRELKSFSLKEIGEMQCYCRIAKPKLALMVSLQGLAPQVDKLINHNKKHNIISYGSNQLIKIFRWDEEAKQIDQFSITPLEDRNFFNL